MKPVRIVLVDDHPLLRKGLRALLERNSNMEVAGEASDALEGIRLVKELSPDVVLMDIRMPVINGREAVEIILKDRPDTNIIILTAFEEETHMFETIRLGVKGLLLKNIEPDRLVDSILRVSCGETVISDSLSGKISSELRKIERKKGVSPTDAGLGEREKEILCLLAEGLSNQEIASELNLPEETLRDLVGHILAVLNLKNHVQAAIYAIENGLTSKSENPDHR